MDQAKSTKPKRSKESNPVAVRRSGRTRTVSQLSDTNSHDKALPTSTAEPVEEPVTELTSRPQRKAKTAFENRLAEIVEEERTTDEGMAQHAEEDDRNVGGYQFDEEEWKRWEKEWEIRDYEVENDFEDDGGNEGEDSDLGSENPSAQTNSSGVSKQAKVSLKLSKSSKAAKPSKKRLQNLESSDDSDSSEDDGKSWLLYAP
jgi:hypothetical protein